MEHGGSGPVGRINKCYGQAGEVMISLYDGFPADFDMKKEPVYVSIDALPVPLFFRSLERKGPGKAVAVFDDFESEARAAMLVGLPFFLPAEEADGREQESRWVGYTLKDVNSSKEGVITGLVESEMNPLFEVGVGSDTVLIPRADDLIVNVRHRKKIIEMALPDGIWDM